MATSASSTVSVEMQEELVRLKKLDQDRENILKEVELRNE